MAIPTGDIPHLAPLQQVIAIDDILQHLIQGVPHMQRSIGIGRSIVKDKRLTGIGLSKGLVNLRLSPKLLNLRLTGLGIRPHAEAGLGEINGFFVGLVAHSESWLHGLEQSIAIFYPLGGWGDRQSSPTTSQRM